MMNLPLAGKALVSALSAASLSLGGAWLAAISIQAMPSSLVPAAPSVEIVSTPELVAQGQEFFGTSCSQCHGDDATGDEGPNLHNLSLSNARIARTIKNGIKGEMPTFAKKYNDQQIGAIVSYLRSLH